MKAILHIDTVTDHRAIPVEIVGETHQQYEIRLLEDALIPRLGPCEIGTITAVPKYAVVLEVDEKQLQSSTEGY